MTTNTKTDVSLDDVLHEMALTSARPDAKVLGDFIRRYPKYVDEITDFAAELAAVAMSDEADDGIEPSTTGTSPAVSRALSRLQNRLYEVKKEQLARGGSVPNPFASLSQEQFRAVATALHATPFFVMKLRDRTIAPETIPAGFRIKVASVLGVPDSLVATHFAAPAEIRDGTRFMSDQKPETSRQQSYADAVKNSSLNDEQQQYLLAL